MLYRGLAVIAGAAAVVVTFLAGAGGAAPPPHRSTFLIPLRHAVSQPHPGYVVPWLASSPKPLRRPLLVPDRARYLRAKRVAERSRTGRRAADSTPPTAAAASILRSFSGWSETEAGNVSPPDVQVAAGPTAVMEMVNLAGGIWDRLGNYDQPFTLSSFFGTGADAITDPRVLYDTTSGRWFASILDITTGNVVIAVSETTQPTSPWTLYTLRDGRCPDQPKIGTANDVVVVSANIFTRCSWPGSVRLGTELWVLNKAQLLTGRPLESDVYGPNPSYDATTPAQALGPTATAYLASVRFPAAPAVSVFSVIGLPPASSAAVASVPIDPLTIPPGARQPGTTIRVDTGDNRIVDAAWQGGTLWLTANDRCLPAGDVADRSCGRISAIATGPGTRIGENELGAAGEYVFYPALRPDSSGNLEIVYGFSSSTAYPSVAVVTKPVDGSFSSPRLVVAGRAPETSGRFGDYFGAARDPATTTTIWVAGETGQAPGWATTIGAVGTAPLPPPPPQPDVTRPHAKALRSQGRRGHIVRVLFNVSDDSGEARIELSIFRRSTRIKLVRWDYSPLNTWSYDYFKWRAPRTRGTYRFCVQAWDRAKNASGLSCSRIRIR